MCSQCAVFLRIIDSARTYSSLLFDPLWVPRNARLSPSFCYPLHMPCLLRFLLFNVHSASLRTCAHPFCIRRAWLEPFGRLVAVSSLFELVAMWTTDHTRVMFGPGCYTPRPLPENHLGRLSPSCPRRPVKCKAQSRRNLEHIAGKCAAEKTL